MYVQFFREEADVSNHRRPGWRQGRLFIRTTNDSEVEIQSLFVEVWLKSVAQLQQPCTCFLVSAGHENANIQISDQRGLPYIEIAGVSNERQVRERSSSDSFQECVFDKLHFMAE